MDLNDSFGLQLLHEPKEKALFITVFVHGLDGGNISTWRNSQGILWPMDWFSKDVPEARIYSFGYSNESWDNSGKSINANAVCLAKELKNILSLPILFVGHNLGGLVIIQSILMDPLISSITKGELFKLNKFDLLSKV
jgi:hypothetical protein